VNLVCRHCRRPSRACACPKGVSTREPLVPARDPEAGIRKHADEIRMQILRNVLDNERWAKAVDFAVERSTSIGAQEYGDASYYKTDEVLEWEGDCELADWIFYLHIPLERAG
jgi:hypothetical protein